MPENDWAHQLWQLWQQGQQPSLAEFLAGAGPLAPLELAGVLRVDQRHRRLIGQNLPAEHYLHAYPIVAADEEAAFDIVYNEICLRREQGETITPDEFLQRFPLFAELLRLQLDFGQALVNTPLVPGSPEKTVLQAVFPIKTTDGPFIPGYRILGTLGQGGMGVVYRAEQINPPRPVALKMILSGGFPSPEELARFRAEAAAIARLSSPNIVQIYEVGEYEGRPYFSLEFVEGVNLAHKALETPEPPEQAAALVETLAHAMHHAHQRGLVHRDLKPANILLRTDGTPKIADFGLARFLDSSAHLTLPNDFLGTPSYTSPEQAAGQSHAAGPAADVYALGGILYFLLTGRPPFAGGSVLSTLELVRTQDPTPPRHFRQGIPRDLEIICLKCLQKAPHQRYASAEALAEDLSLFRQGKPIRARPTPAWERLVKWCRRRPTTAALVGALAVLVLVGTVTLTVAQVRERWRLYELRGQAESHLHEAREAAERRQWPATEVRLDTVRQRTAAEPTLTDLHARASALGTAYAHFREYLRQRDEALFQGLYSTLFPGSHVPDPLFPEDMPEERTSWLSESQRVELADSRREMLLLQADVAARSGSGADPAARRRQAQEALQILERAGREASRTHAYHRRRAYYLGLLGQEEDRKQAEVRAEALAPDSALDHFLCGLHDYMHGDPGRAVRSFEAALRRQPDHFWSQFALAVSQLGLGHFLPAKYCLNDCAKQRPDLPWVLLLRGAAEIQLGDLASAEEDFRQVESALERNRTVGDVPRLLSEKEAGPVLSVNRGMLCFKRNQWPEAAGHFSEAVRQQPQLYQAHAGLLRVLLAQNRFTEADQRFPALAALNPPAQLLAEYHTLRARQLSLSGKHQEALAACQAAEAVRTDAVELFAIRGDILLRLHRDQEAADAFDRYLDRVEHPLADAFRGRGQARMKRGRFGEAGDDFLRAIDLNGVPAGLPAVVGLSAELHRRLSEAELRVYRGSALFFSNAFELALEEFNTAQRLNPGHSGAFTGRGLCKVMLDRYEDAVKDAGKALQLGPTDPETRFNVGCIFALAVGKAGKDEKQPKRQELETMYRTEAITQVRAALRMYPPEQRSVIWVKRWRDDWGLNPIRASAEFAQLDRDFSAPQEDPAPRKH